MLYPFSLFNSCTISSSVTGYKNIVPSTLSGEYCVNKISLHLGILFASDGPIFTKKLLNPLAIDLSPVTFDSSPLNSVLICFPFFIRPA